MTTLDIENVSPKISRLAMGCWAMGGHGWGKVDDKDSCLAVKKALESGVNFFDTADVYGLGRSEKLLSSFLGTERHLVVIATKGGVRVENGKRWVDNSPTYLQKSAEKSLKRLKLDTIPIYYVHQPDNLTPINAMMEGLARLREEGKIQAVGLSNFPGEQILEAHRCGGVDIVQGQWNLLYPAMSSEIVHVCQDQKIPFVAWGVLADGLLTGKFSEKTQFSADDHRSRAPHFIGKEFVRNLHRVKNLIEFANKKGVRVSQIALSWVLYKAPNTCALFGARNSAQVAENIRLVDIKLTDIDFREVELLALYQ